MNELPQTPAPMRWALIAPVALVMIAALLLSLLRFARAPGDAAQVPGQPATSMVNSVGMKLILIPGGEFTMGGDASVPANQRPSRTVKVAPFYLAEYEVTQGQWAKVMSANPSAFKDPRRPVEQVSWFEAQEFITRLNRLEKTDKYRLPSEAEWEYAARAGSQERFFFGSGSAALGQYAWYGQAGNVGTRPVGQRAPNAWGLFDVYGNVWEWVADCWLPDYDGAPLDARPRLAGECGDRVVRGGGWNSAADYVGSAVRGSYAANLDDAGNGLRVARAP